MPGTVKPDRMLFDEHMSDKANPDTEKPKNMVCKELMSNKEIPEVDMTDVQMRDGMSNESYFMVLA